MLCNFHSTKELSVREIGTIPNVVNNFFQTKKGCVKFHNYVSQQLKQQFSMGHPNFIPKVHNIHYNLVTYLHDVQPIPHGQGKALGKGLLFSWSIPTKCAKYVHTLPCHHLTIFEWVKNGAFFFFFIFSFFCIMKRFNILAPMFFLLV